MDWSAGHLLESVNVGYVAQDALSVSRVKAIAVE